MTKRNPNRKDETMNQRNQNTGIVAVQLAAIFAQEIGLLPGNLWEPPISRAIKRDLSVGKRKEVEAYWRFRLGLV